MKAQIEFDAELARLYDETRPIDPEACRACFRDALRSTMEIRDPRIVDVGCGTGRILECVVPKVIRKDQIIGIDISVAMLDVAKSKRALRGIDFRNISVVTFAKESQNHKHFDVVICHWLFHCLANWRSVFRTCIDLAKTDGMLMWLQEEGDLYRALDGMITSNKPLKHLFDAYYASVNREMLAHGLDRITPATRTGTSLRCTDALTAELDGWGWKVESAFKVHQWTKLVTVSWIVESILKTRAFTNLRQIPHALNARGINALKERLGNGGVPDVSESLQLQFCAKPIIARQSPTTASGAH